MPWARRWRRADEDPDEEAQSDLLQAARVEQRHRGEPVGPPVRLVEREPAAVGAAERAGVVRFQLRVVRGGEGQAFTDAISRDWDGLVMQDLYKVTDALAALPFVDASRMGAMGWSWGGYSSLIVPYSGRTARTASLWQPGGPVLRIYAGLEDLDDLEADLAAGFERLRAAA